MEEIEKADLGEKIFIFIVAVGEAAIFSFLTYFQFIK